MSAEPERCVSPSARRRRRQRAGKLATSACRAGKGKKYRCVVCIYFRQAPAPNRRSDYVRGSFASGSGAQGAESFFLGRGMVFRREIASGTFELNFGSIRFKRTRLASSLKTSGQRNEQQHTCVNVISMATRAHMLTLKCV